MAKPISKLAQLKCDIVFAFAGAFLAGHDANTGPDDGTSNRDCATFRAKGIPEKFVVEHAKNLGLIVEKMHGGLWRNHYRVYLDEENTGQASRNTRIADAITASLKKDGIDAMTYSQMD